MGLEEKVIFELPSLLYSLQDKDAVPENLKNNILYVLWLVLSLLAHIPHLALLDKVRIKVLLKDLQSGVWM